MKFSSLKIFRQRPFPAKIKHMKYSCNVCRPIPILVAKVWQQNLDYAKHLQVKYFTDQNILIYGTLSLYQNMLVLLHVHCTYLFLVDSPLVLVPRSLRGRVLLGRLVTLVPKWRLVVIIIGRKWRDPPPLGGGCGLLHWWMGPGWRLLRLFCLGNTAPGWPL